MITALYPGSFDPVTNGHLDVIERAASIFDRLVVTVFRNPNKQHLFSIEERVDMIREATRGFANVEVDSFEGLLIDYARRRGTRVIVKGLRAVSDFEYEFQMALMNKKLAPELETVFIATSQNYSYLSSSLIKEVVRLGGRVTGLVPDFVEARLREKLRPGT